VPTPLTVPSAAGSKPRLASVHRLPLGAADDATLARALAAGDEAAATAVWERHAPLVRSVLRRSLGPYDDVEDGVQEVFLRFFRQVGELRDPGALRSFLIGIAMHVAVSALRRRRVRRWLRLTDTGVVPDPPAEEREGGDEAREAMRRLYAILDRLDDAGRLTFVLRYIEGLELAQVAEALSVSLATTKRRLAKVTARVLAMIERDPVLPEYARVMLAARREGEA
jgi:RNA polymerase sigma-70 factor (ECF subfamily)